MDAQPPSEVEFQLRKLFARYGQVFAFRQWPSEHQRWVELVFALIAQIGKQPEDRIREAVHTLDELELLDVQDLSAIPSVGTEIDDQSVKARRIIGELLECGLSAGEARRCLLAVHDAARSLVEHHDGKIQRYLRHYGDQMLRELSDHFTIRAISPAELRDAFAYWQQNVLNMPVNLMTPSGAAFCTEHGISEERLVEAADRLDLNLALVDDLIDLQRGGVATREQPQAPARAAELAYAAGR